MVVFSRSHIVGEGINFWKDNLEIDLIVRKISGPRNFRSAVLEVCGVEGLEKISLAPSDRFSDVYDGIGVKIARSGSCGSNRVSLSYIVPDDYRFQLRVYPEFS